MDQEPPFPRAGCPVTVFAPEKPGRLRLSNVSQAECPFYHRRELSRQKSSKSINISEISIAA
jgi:hypothetical protein